MSLNKNIFNCFPMYNQNEGFLGHVCYQNKEIENFETVGSVENYNNSKIYKKGDIINAPDGNTYIMIDGIGAAGYAPPRPNNWQLYTLPQKAPTFAPTFPTTFPTTFAPTFAPTFGPMRTPTMRTPTMGPTMAPTMRTPTMGPTMAPAMSPTMVSTMTPTMMPTIGPTFTLPPMPIPKNQTLGITDIYDDSITYNIGDIVFKGNKAYTLIDDFAAPGFPPPKLPNWAPLDYNKSTIYKINDIVNGTDGYIYEMIKETGSAGDPPPNDSNWVSFTYDNTKIYYPGNIVLFSDGNIYKMIKGVGTAGNIPSNISSNLWKKSD